MGAISFSLSLFIARHAGASHFGQYSTALAIGSILAIVLDGGLRNLLTRERTKPSEHLSGFFEELPQISMGHSLLAAILTSVLCFIFFADQLFLGLGIIWCFWGSVITQYASAILRGDGYIKTYLIWQLKQRALTAAIIAITVFFDYFEAWQLLFAWSIGAMCANLFFKEGFRFRPLFNPLLSLNFKMYQTLLPLFWLELATAIYFRSDLIMLSAFNVSNDEIGQYSAAYRLIEAAIFLASPISIIIFRKARLLNEKKRLQKNYIIQSLFISTLLGLTGFFFLECFATNLVKLAYGPQYDQTAELLATMGLMIILLIPNMVLTQVALALDLEKFYALTATLAAIVNIGFNFAFIPKYGIISAVYCSILTELILFMGLSLAIFLRVKER